MREVDESHGTKATYYNVADGVMTDKEVKMANNRV